MKFATAMLFLASLLALGGSATLAIAANACLPGNALAAFPFTCSPVLTNGSNALLGNVTATLFSGDANENGEGEPLVVLLPGGNFVVAG